MGDEEEQVCNNCKRPVSSSNFASHSAFCERKVFVCEVCDEPVLISERNKHSEDYHVISQCDLCEAAVEKWMLPKHKEKCPRRPIICQYCEQDFPANEYGEHLEFCGSRTEKCLLCQKYIMNKEKEEHSKFHRYEKEINAKIFREEIHQNKVNEVVSRNNTTENISEKTSKAKYDTYNRFDSQTSMQPSFEEARASVPDEPNSYIRREKQNWEIQSSEGAVARLPTKNEEKRYGQCHICKLKIPWIDMNTHIPSCASFANKCSLCGENVSSSTIKDHMKEHFSNSQRSPQKVLQNNEPLSKSFSNASDKIQNSNEMMCPFCSSLLPTNEILEHSRYCAKTVYKCPLCCENILKKDRERHQNSECRIIQTNDTNTFNYSNFYECPLCSENVLEKDRENHTTFNCRSLLQSSGPCGFLSMRGDKSDMYECPLCLKLMLAKEKQYHESFECSVLIETCRENIPEPQSYSEVTKKTCAGNCKSKQNSSEICLKCKNRIPDHKIVEHRKNCPLEKRLCRFCEDMIVVSREEMHLKYCPGLNTNNIYSRCHSKGPSSKTSHENKGAKPRNLKEMMQPQTGKCKHCATTLNIDILTYHEEECVHQPVECSECSKKISMKDLEDHHCKKNKKGKKQKSNRQASEDKEEPGLKQKFLSFFKTSSNLENDESENVNRQYSSLHQQKNSSCYGFPTAEQNEPLYFSGNDTTLIPCEFCGLNWPAFDLVRHETGCQPDLISYAKPDLSKDTNKNISNLESNSRPVRSNSSMKDSVLNDKLKDKHLAKDASPFFTRKHSSSSSASPECISHTSKSNAKPGEFLQFCEKTSRNEESPVWKGNQIKEKKEKPLNFQSVWNTKTYKDSITEDNDSQQISDQSDAEMDIDQPGNYSSMNKKNEMDVEEHSEVLAKADNDLLAMLKFIDSKNTESNEEYGDFSALRHEMKPKSLGSRDNEVPSYVLDSCSQEKHEKDFSHPKKDVHEESKTLFSETVRSVRPVNEDENNSPKLSYNSVKHNRSLASSSGKIGHKAVPFKHNFEEPEKMCRESNPTYFSDEEKEISNYKKRFPDFKFASKDNPSLDSQDNKHNAEVPKKNQETGDILGYPASSSGKIGHKAVPFKHKFEEPEKMCRKSNPIYFSDDEEEISNYKKCFPDFKFASNVNPSLASQDNKHNAEIAKKNQETGDVLGYPLDRISRQVDDTKIHREHLSDFKELKDFKFDINNSKLSSEEIGHQISRHIKNNQNIEKVSKQDISKYVYGSNDEEESVNGFKLTSQERKSFYAGDNIHSTTQPEKNNKEPEKLIKQQLDESSREQKTKILVFDSKKDEDCKNSAKGFADSKETEKLSKQNSSHSDYSHYLPDFKFGARETKFLHKNDILSDFTRKPDAESEESAFNLKPATSLKMETRHSMSKDKRAITDLDERIAKLKMSSLKDDVSDVRTDAYSHRREDSHLKDIAEAHGEKLKYLKEEFEAQKAKYKNIIKNVEQQNDFIKRNSELDREKNDLMKESAVLEDRETKELLEKYYHESQTKWRETHKQFSSSDSD